MGHLVAMAEVEMGERRLSGEIDKRGKVALMSHMKQKGGIIEDQGKALLYCMPLAQLYETLGSNENGLTAEESEAYRDLQGENALTPPAQRSECLKFIDNLTGFFSLLLWLGSFLCFVAFGIDVAANGELYADWANLYLGIVLAVVTFVTGVFSYYQEAAASNLMKEFADMATVQLVDVKRRQGDSFKVENINSKHLVAGDIVELKFGMKTPADVHLVDSTNIKVDNSSLTGEPDHLSRQPSDDEGECGVQESTNMCFYTTKVMEGSGWGIVTAIGDRTFMGTVAGLTLDTDAEDTPIKKEIHGFINIVSSIAIFLGATFFIIGMIKTPDPLRNLVFMIGIIVANVPEGLLATVTVSLALTAKRMYEKNVLVKNLESVETLGSTTMIASDKTGTLTINKMTVANLCVDTAIFETADGRTAAQTYPLVDKTRDSVRKITSCMTNCNNATWVEKAQIAQEDMPEHNIRKGDPIPYRLKVEIGGAGSGQFDNRIMWFPQGDASESAMIKYAQESPIYSNSSAETVDDAPGIEAARKEYPKCQFEQTNDQGGKTTKVWEIKFNSKNKYQVSVHRQTEPGKENIALLMMKGAPERILNRCDHVWHEGERIPLTPELRQKYEELNVTLAKMGRRCLAFCDQELDVSKFPADWKDFSTEPVNYPIGNDEEECRRLIAEAEKDGMVPPSLEACGK